MAWLPTDVRLFLKTAAPTVTDDINDGYENGDVVVDINNKKAYILVDNAVGAADWNQIDGGGGTGTVDTSGIPADDDYAKFTDADTIEGRNSSEVKTDLSLNNVENTAHSADAHTMNIDGRDVSVDGSKLDGIESLADVTSTNETSHADVLLDGDVGIADNKIVSMDDSGPANAEEYVRLTASGLEGRSKAEHLSDLNITNKNAIINGLGEINQRVTAYTLIKDAYCWDSSSLYGPDRFECMATGTAVNAGTFAQSIGAPVGVTGKAFHFAGVTLTGTGILYFRYRMEAKDAVKFKNQIASFSCRVYHDTGGAIDYTVYIRKANSEDNFGAVTAISNSGAISIPDSAASDCNHKNVSMGDCSNGIEIEIKIEPGAITTKNFYFTEVQFELGSIVTDFEYRQFGDELLKCQRFFCKSYNYDVSPGTAVSNGANTFHLDGINNSTHLFRISTFFPVHMLTDPTINLYDLVGNSGKVTMDSGDNVSGSINVNGHTGFTVSGYNGTVSTTMHLGFHYTAQSEL